MQDILTMVASLDRPKLLVQAARFGVDGYNRAQILPALLDRPTIPTPGQALICLMDVEAAHNALRLEKASHYQIADHVTALIAIMGEARLFRACAGHISST